MRVEERLAAGTAQASPETTETQKVRTARGSQEPAAARSADRLQLSSLAEQIRGVFDGMAAEHAARVERVAGEVQSGRYQVDVARLSRALASEALR